MMEEFKVSVCAVCQTRNLIKEKGLLAVTQPRKGKLLSEDVIRKDFYF